MAERKPRQYLVTWAAREELETVIIATSADEAARIAYEEYDVEWNRSSGDYIGLPKAKLVRNPAQKRWLKGEGYVKPETDDSGEER